MGANAMRWILALLLSTSAWANPTGIYLPNGSVFYDLTCSPSFLRDSFSHNCVIDSAGLGGPYLPLSGGTVTGPTTFTGLFTLDRTSGYNGLIVNNVNSGGTPTPEIDVLNLSSADIFRVNSDGTGIAANGNITWDSGGDIQGPNIDTNAAGIGGVALGQATQSLTTSGISIGDNAQGEDGVAIGSSTIASSAGVAIGNGSAGFLSGVAIGTNAGAGFSGFAIGDSSEAYFSGFAIGNNAEGSGGAMAIGNNAIATGTNTIEIGPGTASISGDLNVFGYPLMDQSGNIDTNGNINILGPEAIYWGDGSQITNDGLGDLFINTPNYLNLNAVAVTMINGSSFAWTDGGNISDIGSGILSIDQLPLQMYPSQNILIGPNAGSFIATGSGGADNVALGADTAINLSGSGNLAIGTYALYGAYGSSEQNIAIGYDAIGGNANGTMNQNLAIGTSTLNYNTSGSNNVALGFGAGGGYSLGVANLDGSNNTFIGTYSGSNNASGVYRTAIGYGSVVSYDHQIMLGTSTEFVTAPNELEIGTTGTLGTSGVANAIINSSGSITATNNITLGQHLISNAAGSGSSGVASCGTGASVSGNDVHGSVTIGTVATTCQINFYSAYGATPVCILTPTNSTAAASLLYISSANAAHFVVSGTAISSGHFNYFCVQ